MVSFKWDADMAKEVWQEEAMEKGVKKGMEKGMEKATEKTALEMLRNKLDINLIKKCTNLSLNRITELSKML